MTGGNAIILGAVGDNFGAGMTGGMAFIYDEKNEFENYANPASIIWQSVETDYWKNFLKENIKDFETKTSSKKAKRILENFEEIRAGFFRPAALIRIRQPASRPCR